MSISQAVLKDASMPIVEMTGLNKFYGDVHVLKGGLTEWRVN